MTTEQVIDWRARGYFRFPLGDTLPVVEPEYLPGWYRYQEDLERLARGENLDFEKMWDDAKRAPGWQISGAYTYLIGNGAPAAFLETLRVVDFRRLGDTVHAMSILGLSGILAEVPTLLSFICEFVEIGEFQGTFWDLARLLDDGTTILSDARLLEDLENGQRVATYRTAVMGAYQALTDRLGTANVRVLHGDVFDIRNVVSTMRQSANKGGLNPKLRQVFEAFTGIDCTSFYVDRVPQPNAIHSVLDWFERDGKPERFVPGQRYFLGHAVERP